MLWGSGEQDDALNVACFIVRNKETGEYNRLILDDARTTSTTYPGYKSQQTFILVEKNTGRTIEVNEIISENDSIIVCKK